VVGVAEKFVVMVRLLGRACIPMHASLPVS
jgi:hypothetical protein